MYLEGIGPSGAATMPATTITSQDLALLHAHRVFAGRAMAHLTPDILDWFKENGIQCFHLAGGALLRGEPADLDIFPFNGFRNEKTVSARNFDALAASLSTKQDAQLGECRDFPVKLQLCRHLTDSLEALVSGFDFAHCQVGVTVEYGAFNPGERRAPKWGVTRCHMTPAFTAAMMVQGTFYCGGKWPLRSLTRVPKVAAKLSFDTGEARELAIQVTREIVEKHLGSGDDLSFVENVLGCNLPKICTPSPAPAKRLPPPELPLGPDVKFDGSDLFQD